MKLSYRRRGGRAEDLVTASEVTCYAYCPEQWRLEYGLGLPAKNQAALDAGTRHHARKAPVERLAGWAIRLGQVIVVAALLLLVLWAISR